MDISSSSKDIESDPSFISKDIESDPSFMIDESDDEETIAEEELMEPEIDPQEELRILAEDLNVSVGELAAQSGCINSRRNHKPVDYQAMVLEEQMKKCQGVEGETSNISLLSNICTSLDDMNRAGPSKDTNVTFEEPTAQSGCRRSKRKLKKVDYQAMLLEEQMKMKSQNAVVETPEVPSLSNICTTFLNNINSAGPSTDCPLVIDRFSELTKFYLSNTNEDEEADADVDYKPMRKQTFSREIRVGPTYQAEVPEEPAVTISTDVNSQYYDQLMWIPCPVLSDEQINTYLTQVNSIVKLIQPTERLQALRKGAAHKDNEKALEVLLQCNNNPEIALNIFKQRVQQYLNEQSSKSKAASGSENDENKTDNSNENIENEVRNEIPTSPKVPKIENTTTSQL